MTAVAPPKRRLSPDFCAKANMIWLLVCVVRYSEGGTPCSAIFAFSCRSSQSRTGLKTNSGTAAMYEPATLFPTYACPSVCSKMSEWKARYLSTFSDPASTRLNAG